VFDPFSDGLRAIGMQHANAAGLAFLAGAASCAGPCVAPRFIAVTALASRETPRSAWRPVGAFLCGLVGAYASFGAIASVLGWAASRSTEIYAAAAAALAICGVFTLMRESSSSEGACKHQAAASGGPFLLGASSALIVSPCCAPMVFGIVSYTTALGKPLYGCMLLACFAVGHAVPLVAAAFGAHRAAAIVCAKSFSQAVNVVSGSLMIALAGLYAVLA
jgi:cytochrome c-type biogenesis protein